MTAHEIERVLAFWFDPALRAHWFASTPEIDADIRQRFEALWERAARGDCDDWATSAEGALALAIVLDQFPLNMFRRQAKGFSTEAQAIAVAKGAIARGLDKQIPLDRRAFLYLPLMHSEHPQDQDLSVQLFEQAGLANNLRWAQHHRELIRRFGRFPHRNAILGRESGPEELAYLESKEAFRG